MRDQGWKQLLADDSWANGEQPYSIEAYSEFMPPPRLGRKAYGHIDELLFAEDDPWGWHVTEYEEQLELRPGLMNIGRQLLHALGHLGRREPAHGIARAKLANNPYWPAELQASGAPSHERYVVLMPLALSKTQDDKGRVRWTLFGASEQGPANAFWKSAFTGPRSPLDPQHAIGFFSRLLATVYHETAADLAGLRKAGFRFLISDNAPGASPAPWREPKLPDWTAELAWKPGRPLRGVKYLFTFDPFASLPAPVRKAYLSGDLHLLPFPGSLVFWGVAPYIAMQKKLPFASQIPLLHSVERHEAPTGIRVPQSGWLHEPRPGDVEFGETHGPLRNTFRRTHRWAKVHRHDDEVALTEHEDKMAHVLFSTAPDDLGLYGKPMARNAQIWTREFEPLLDGPRSSRKQLCVASAALAEGGAFGYRFLFPAMRVGAYEVYWHRPLAGYLAEDGEPQFLEDAPLGYLTAYDAAKPKLAKPIELWPRLLARPAHKQALTLFPPDHDHHYRRTTTNVRKLLETARLLGPEPIDASLARSLLTLNKHESPADWFAALPAHASDPAAGKQFATELATLVTSEQTSAKSNGKDKEPESFTFARTARRSFEVNYWKTIFSLATGKFVNKDNADCALDRVTREQKPHAHRDLEALGDHLLKYYAKVIAAEKMTDQVWAGELPFHWRTEFDYSWQGGWLGNQDGATYERDLLVMIPGRDRRRAVIMADHYDTAYMEDHYGYGKGGGGPRFSAAGADDNHSATATLMLAAPIYMELSRQNKLACDVWLVHLTGEEFPSDCLGARHLTQGLIDRRLPAREPGAKRSKNLGRTRIDGLYVMDMIAHNNDREPDVFQICPGASRESMWLALQAHIANRTWNESAPIWNRRKERQGRQRGKRSADGKTLPEVALFPQLRGEVRPPFDPRSTLYNTDGQIFSDAGVPCVLMMENYDINRHGYHDSFDTMENIDLDYGSAVSATTIEAVARAAILTPPWR